MAINSQETVENAIQTDKVVPTLYIAVGGTGMEMALRLRRRILNSFWGKNDKPVRLSSLAEFPVAQFLHIDLDHGANRESDKSKRTDLLADAVTFSDEERVVESFDMGRYIRSADNMAMYPHIQNWFPLTPSEINELKIDPSKGAGQIRAISRLYFFDKIKSIKARIREKLEHLKNCTSNKAALDHLGLATYDKFRIVVLTSSAGGTGAGAFLDTGYLAQFVAKQFGRPFKVDLVLMLASGYAKYGQRVEANTYAALMELETCIFERIPYVTGWEAGERPELPSKPYDDVYLVDTANLDSQSTARHADIHDMVASALFEDYSLAAFADRKRQVEVNQQQYKLAPFKAPLPTNRFGDTEMAFAKSYSAFGQSVVDTQVQAHQSMRLYRQSNAMLAAFFGVAEGSSEVSNQPTEVERDEFMQESFWLRRFGFADTPDFAARVELKYVKGEFWDYALTDELLRDVNKASVVANIENKVNADFNTIRTSVSQKDWEVRILETIKQLKRDVMKTVDSNALTSEDRIEERRRQLIQSLQAEDGLSKRLYVRLDDKERGGLDYTISLVELIKDRIENEATGFAHNLDLNAKRFRELSESLGGAELEKLFANLRQTGGLFSSKTQGETVLAQIQDAVAAFMTFHCRSVASTQAALLLREMSMWLGQKTGVDASADPIWTGFVGELIAGRNAVKSLIAEIDGEIASIEQSTKEGNATYRVLQTELIDAPLVTGVRARDWAEDSFKDFGGSKELFRMLKTAEGKSNLLGALRSKAAEQMPPEQYVSGQNPLIKALQEMGSVKRIKLFGEMLSLAMPWVNANLNGDWQVDPKQYTCLIGVQNKPLFEELFGNELRQALPARSKLTADRIWVEESGIPGRMVIYTELSGLPLTALNLLKETWGTSYRQISKEIPCHTHRNRGWFKHPVQLTATELGRLAEDFKLYLQAVSMNVLRRKQRDDGSSTYQVELARGDYRGIGGERTVRLEGLEEGAEVNAIRNQLSSKMEDVRTALQWAALASLMEYYAKDVYPPREATSDLGKDIRIKGFAWSIADVLRQEYARNAEQIGLERAEEVYTKLRDRINTWTQVILDSKTDAYHSEVHVEHENKRHIKADFFTEGWLEEVTGLSSNGSQAIVAVPTSAAPSATARAATGLNDIMAVLEKLAALKTAGMLTEEEFSSKKAELLKRLV